MFNKRKLKSIVCLASAVSLLTVAVGCNGGGTSTSTPSPAATASASAEGFTPKDPVTMLVPAAPGGSTDMLARAIEKVWPKYVDVPVQVVNKGGGGGVEAATTVARAKPDGYTFIMGYGSGHDIVMPHIQKVEYNPLTDLEPVARVSIATVMVLAQAESEFNKVSDIVDWAKKENKPVTAAVSTTAGAVDLVMRGIGKSTGITVTPIPHSGGSQAITSLLGGQTLIGGGHPAEVVSHIKSGKLKPLAIATKERDPVFPELETLIEQGIDFSTWGSIKGIALPAKTPVEIKEYYSELFGKICADEEFKKTMSDIAQPILYEDMATYEKSFKQAYDETGELVKELGLVQK